MGFLIVVFFGRRFFIFQEKKLKIASHKLGFNGRGEGGGKKKPRLTDNCLKARALRGFNLASSFPK